MGDAGEGLIDADARIQERMEELALSRAKGRTQAVRNPEQVRQLDGLKLARAETVRQLELATHDARKAQLQQALAELDKRIGAGTGLPGLSPESSGARQTLPTRAAKAAADAGRAAGSVESAAAIAAARPLGKSGRSRAGAPFG